MGKVYRKLSSKGDPMNIYIFNDQGERCKRKKKKVY